MTKHPLLFVALLSLLSVVAALIILHFSPGEQGGQLEGVAITQVSVLEEDGGEIPLSDGLSRRLVTLLRQYDRLSYSALPSYTPQPGDLLLTGPNHGTCFYLTADAPPTLVRVNHDGYSAVAKRSADGASLGEDPAYAQWRQDLAAYQNFNRPYLRRSYSPHENPPARREQGDFRLGMYEVQRNCPVLGSTLSRLASLRAYEVGVRR